MYANKITELAKILAPPDAPLDQGEEWLERNQGILRISFPSDFVDFGRTYGSGEISSAYSWEVWSPFRPTYPLIVLEFSRIWHIYKDAMEVTDVPFGIFHEEIWLTCEG